MQEVEHLTEQLREANKNLKPCYCGCSKKVVIDYDPGCTYVRCEPNGESVAALPDWCPEELAEKWNAGHFDAGLSCPEKDCNDKGCDSCKLDIHSKWSVAQRKPAPAKPKGAMAALLASAQRADN